MDPEFREFANELARMFEERVKQHFDASEQRVKQHFDASEARVKTHIDGFEERAERRIKTHIDSFEERAEQRMRMHFENLEATVKLAAEGYVATLDRIERDLPDLKSTTKDGFADIRGVLDNHNERLSTLEQSRP